MIPALPAVFVLTISASAHACFLPTDSVLCNQLIASTEAPVWLDRSSSALPTVKTHFAYFTSTPKSNSTSSSTSTRQLATSDIANWNSIAISPCPFVQSLHTPDSMLPTSRQESFLLSPLAPSSSFSK